ncbi:class I SAM-dependent methyltransferase [Streptomyces sp. NBC_00503]|uniref:class I SAM-dependent methyltransferase n=1 Tax=Streptomyces sp. NBC_00503 TaxID=2903659 RepID=UPI002E819159|nr:methyltransferase [Streptomyces sp. NBC_00503]
MNTDQHQHQQHQHHQHHQHGEGNGHGHGPATEAALAEMLDLDAEVLHDYLTGAVGLIHGLTAGDPPVRRILDVGSGTGTGTFALLRRFEGAEATTLDISAGMLEHLGNKARTLGLADRVHPVRADLDAAWPAVGPADLVWASTSLHHMADPGRALAEIHAALRPGGLLAVAEFDTLPRFLPEDIGIGRPGLEERAQALIDAAKAVDVPHLGSDWGALLAGAGFTIEAEELFTVELTDPLPAAAGRYAQSTLRRVRDHVADRLDAQDRAAFATLLDGEGPEALPHRTDLRIRAQRTVWVARRP